jgi:hypothetical protein
VALKNQTHAKVSHQRTGRTTQELLPEAIADNTLAVESNRVIFDFKLSELPTIGFQLQPNLDYCSGIAAYIRGNRSFDSRPKHE